jgi:cytoplasmic iron level regulating protein YaaA (DUF328/UPF0246 family)
MILSPAKTLDLSPTDRLASRWTNPSCDADKTQQVASALRHRKPKDLEKLLGISASLAKTAQEVSYLIQPCPTAKWKQVKRPLIMPNFS